MNIVVSMKEFPPPPNPDKAINTAREAQFEVAPATEKSEH
jgi:hypothetical protein